MELRIFIFGLVMWPFEAWMLMLSFGIFHAELGWQPHPGYWGSFWLAWAVSIIGIIFTNQSTREFRRKLERR